MDGELRVWLEPGYDHGRTGAWLLDWPGAFTWGRDRDGALARVASAAHRFVEWLAEHGEAAPAPAVAEPAVVEEVPARRLEDGYEVNATFAADRRPASPAEVDGQLRRLEFARDDLLSLGDRLRRWTAGGGQLPVEGRSADALASGASPGREAAEVLRHVAGAEAWFVSRLDGSARYAGPPRDGDLDAYLEGTRRFLVEGMRGLVARDPAVRRIDGRGEEWTLPKVLRRALYHSLDHLWELDRRLAVAERQADRLELRRGARPPARELRSLFASAGLVRRARDSDKLTERMVAGSTEAVSLWDGERLVGFGRVISDEATNAYISTVAIAPRWQERGAGRRLMEALMESREGLKLTLDARAGAEPFYERLGFQKVTSVYVRPRGAMPRRS